MRLRARLVEPDWSALRRLAMEEFTLHKGHRYATAVVDPINRQVLWIGPGPSRETARAFFERLPEGVAASIEGVSIHMTTAYELEIKATLPTGGCGLRPVPCRGQNTDAKSSTEC